MPELDATQTSTSESPSWATHSFTIDDLEAGRRLDQALAALVPELSRSRLKQLIEQGQVAINGQQVTQPKRKVEQGDEIQLCQPPAEEAKHLVAEDIPLDVLYEDETLIVINKPAGLVVHPAAGNPSGTLVNALLHHCGDSLQGIGGEIRPGIVHRLDKDTSGIMVVAKTEQALAHLQTQFSDRTIERAYDAFVWGEPTGSGEIDANIGRSRTHRQKMAVLPEEQGKHALTRFGRIALLGLSASWIECRLSTGRTHQIRVHMAHLGHSLIGDPLYGRATPARRRAYDDGQNQAVADFSRQALHARLLAFEHPVSGDWLMFEQDPPTDMQQLGEALAKTSWSQLREIANNNRELYHQTLEKQDPKDLVEVIWAN